MTPRNGVLPLVTVVEVRLRWQEIHQRHLAIGDLIDTITLKKTPVAVHLRAITPVHLHGSLKMTVSPNGSLLRAHRLPVKIIPLQAGDHLSRHREQTPRLMDGNFANGA